MFNFFSKLLIIWSVLTTSILVCGEESNCFCDPVVGISQCGPHPSSTEELDLCRYATGFPSDASGAPSTDCPFASIDYEELIQSAAPIDISFECNFESATTITAFAIDISYLVVSDFDGNHFNDLIFLAGDIEGNTDYQGHLILNQGTISADNEPVGLDTALSFYPHDIDNDGDFDLIVLTSTEVFWLENSISADFDIRHGISTVDQLTGDYFYQIAVGDMDSDGDLDVMLCLDAELVWLENLGGGYFNSTNSSTVHFMYSFSAISDFATTMQLALADVDNDQDLDMIISYGMKQSSDPASLIWIETTPSGGGGTQYMIKNPSTLQSGGQIWYAWEPADVDNDGDLDIIWVDQRRFGNTASTDPSTIQWFENTGLGLFGPNPRVLDNQFPGGSTLAVGDLNADGWVDFVVGPGADTNRFDLRIYLNTKDFSNGQSGFSLQQSVTALDIPIQLVLADVTGEGTFDIVSAGQATGQIWYHSNTGRTPLLKSHSAFDYELADSQANGLSHRPVQKLYDVDGDSDLDIVSLVLDDIGSRYIEWIPQIGVGSGQFDYNSTISILPTSGSVSWGQTRVFVMADLDNDGDLDIVCAAYSQFKVGFLLNLGDGRNWTEGPLLSSVHLTKALDVADMDNDGDLDVIVMSSVLNKVLWFRNDLNTVSESFYFPATTIGSISVQNQGSTVSVVDLDGDGHDDIVADGKELCVFRNLGNSLDFERTLLLAASEGKMCLGDLNRDGMIDIVSAPSDGQISWHRNEANNNGLAKTLDFTFMEILTSSVDLQLYSLSCVDVDSDGDTDIVYGDATSLGYLPNHRGTFSDFRPFSFNDTDISLDNNIKSYWSILLADLDFDGDMDGVVQRQLQGQINIFINQAIHVYVDPVVGEDRSCQPCASLTAAYESVLPSGTTLPLHIHLSAGYHLLTEHLIIAGGRPMRITGPSSSFTNASFPPITSVSNGGNDDDQYAVPVECKHAKTVAVIDCSFLPSTYHQRACIEALNFDAMASGLSLHYLQIRNSSDVSCLRADASPLRLHNVELRECSSHIDNVLGGGLGVHSGAGALLSKVLITGSRAYNGGGIYVDETSSLVCAGRNSVQCLMVLDSFASQSGGAIYLESSNIHTLYKSYFVSNSADVYGGAVYFTGGVEVNLEYIYFEGNSARDGGAIYSQNIVNLIHSSLTNNSCSNFGGALYHAADVQVNIVDTNLTENQASIGGGAIYWVHQEPVMSDPLKQMFNDTRVLQEYGTNNGIACNVEALTVSPTSTEMPPTQMIAKGQIISPGFNLAFVDCYQQIVKTGFSLPDALVYLRIVVENGTTASFIGTGSKTTRDGLVQFSDLIMQAPPGVNTTWSFEGVAYLPTRFITTVSYPYRINSLPCDYGMLYDDGKGYCVSATGFYTTTTGAVEPCDKGYYTDEIDSIICRACGLGTYQSQTAQTACIDCIPGKNQGSYGQSQCFACAEGYFSASNASSACTRCESGVSINNATGCEPLQCPADSTLVNSGLEYFCQCIIGFYMSENNDQCIECAEGMICDRTGVAIDSLQLLSGYIWDSHADGSVQVLKCPYGTDACPSSVYTGNTSCATGYSGLACSVCADDYYLSVESICKECQGSIVSLIVIVSVIVVLAVLAICLYLARQNLLQCLKDPPACIKCCCGQRPLHNLRSHLASYDEESRKNDDINNNHNKSVEKKDSGRNKKKKKLGEEAGFDGFDDNCNHSTDCTDNTETIILPTNDRKFGNSLVTKLTIVIAFLQVLAVIDQVYTAPWPDFFTDATSIFKVFLGSLLTLSGASCYLDVNHFDTLLVQTITPLSLLLIAILVSVFVPKHRTKCIQFIVILMLLTYPGISLVALQTLNCQQLGDQGVASEYYLTADYSIICWQDTHVSYAVYAVFILSLISVGWPLFLSLLLFYHRTELVENEQFRRRFGLVYRRYKANCYMWEITEIIRKLVMTGIVVFFGTDTSLQLVFGLMFGVIAHLGHSVVAPFKEKTNHMLQHFSLLTIWLTIIAALILRLEVESQNRDIVAGVALVLNMAVPVFAVLIVFFSAHKLENQAFEHLTKISNHVDTLPSSSSSSSSSSSPSSSSLQKNTKYLAEGDDTNSSSNIDQADDHDVKSKMSRASVHDTQIQIRSDNDNYDNDNQVHVVDDDHDDDKHGDNNTKMSKKNKKKTKRGPRSTIYTMNRRKDTETHKGKYLPQVDTIDDSQL